MTPYLITVFCGIFEANGQRNMANNSLFYGTLAEDFGSKMSGIFSYPVFSEHLPQYPNPTHTPTFWKYFQTKSSVGNFIYLRLWLVSYGCGFCLGVDGERMPPSQQVKPLAHHSSPGSSAQAIENPVDERSFPWVQDGPLLGSSQLVSS